MLICFMSRCSYDFLEIIDTHPLEQHSYVVNMTQPYDTPSIMPTQHPSRDYSSNVSFGYHPNRAYKDVDIFENFLSIYKIHHSYLIQTPEMGIISHKASNVYAPRRICGDWNSKVKLLRYRSSGPILGLHFSSDYSHHFGGYKAKLVLINGKYLKQRLYTCGHYLNLFLYVIEIDSCIEMCRRQTETIQWVLLFVCLVSASRLAKCTSSMRWYKCRACISYYR